MSFAHLTYEVAADEIRDPRIKQFMLVLGFREVTPREPAEWPLRWFRSADHIYVHLVGRNAVEMGLGHFCVEVAQEVYDGLRESDWCARDSGSGRIWLEAFGLRVEVRPYVD
jgi:hypothetical protein